MIYSLLLNGEVSWYENGSEKRETASSPEEFWDKLLKNNCSIEAILDKTRIVIEQDDGGLYA